MRSILILSLVLTLAVCAFAEVRHPIQFINQFSKPLYITFYNVSGPGAANWGPDCVSPLPPGGICHLTVGLAGTSRFCASPDGPQNCNDAQVKNLTLFETYFDEGGMWSDISVIPPACTPEMYHINQCTVNEQAGWASYNIPLRMECTNYGWPKDLVAECRGPTGINNFPLNCGTWDGDCLGNQTGKFSDCNQAYFSPEPKFQPVFYCVNLTLIWLPDDPVPTSTATTAAAASTVAATTAASSTTASATTAAASTSNAATTAAASTTAAATTAAATTAAATTLAASTSASSSPSAPSSCVDAFLSSSKKKIYGYSDSLLNGWLDASSVPPPNFFGTTRTHTGAYAIEWKPMNNNKMSLTIPTFTNKQWNTITFWINPVNGGQKITISVNNNGIEYPCTYDLTTFYGGPLTTGWKWVGIPLSSFGLTSANKITGFTLTDASGHANSEPIWLDDISLSSIAPAKTTGAIVMLTQSSSSAGKRGDDNVIYTPDTEATIAAALSKLTGQPALRFVVTQKKGNRAEVKVQQSQGNPMPAAVVAAQIAANHHMLATRTPVEKAEVMVVEANNGMTSGALAGLVVGCLLFIALIVAIVIIAVLIVLRVKEQRSRRNSTEGLLPSADSLNQSLLTTMYMPPNVPYEINEDQAKVAGKSSKEGRWV